MFHSKSSSPDVNVVIFYSKSSSLDDKTSFFIRNRHRWITKRHFCSKSHSSRGELGLVSFAGRNARRGVARRWGRGSAHPCWPERGSKCHCSWPCSPSASIAQSTGRVLGALDEVFANAGRSRSFFHVPELYRMSADLLLARGDGQTARLALEQAEVMAREQA